MDKQKALQLLERLIEERLIASKREHIQAEQALLALKQSNNDND